MCYLSANWDRTKSVCWQIGFVYSINICRCFCRYEMYIRDDKHCSLSSEGASVSSSLILYSLSHCRLVADLSIFYRYFHGHWSQEIKNIIPDPVRCVRTTRSSTYSHPFQVTLPNPRTLSHKSSFIPRTSQLRNSLPPTTFPESYNLSSFKSNINKLDLISLST